MTHPTDKGWRRKMRFAKGMRRVRVDQLQHGSDLSCPCFEANGSGKVFSRFADHPQTCSGPCCGNPRRWHDEPTMQEKRLEPAHSFTRWAS